jgi:hypothetical protein
MKYEKHHTTSLIVREKLWAVPIAAFMVMLLVFYTTATQQKASGFTTITQSLSYNNPEQKITIDYPSDWRVCCKKNGPQRYNPDNMFSVMFDSPTISTSGDVIPLEETMSASITIESLDPQKRNYKY